MGVMTMTICATCGNLRAREEALGGDEERDGDTAVRLVDATLTQLRLSSGGCRACAVLLNGVLFYHNRFATIKEEDIKITAETFPSKALQDHLSVDVRWKFHEEESGRMDVEDDGDDEHEESYPDLRLEFFTDENGQSAFSAIGCGRPIVTNMLHETGIRTIRSMLDECCANHTLCSDNRSHAMPRRLLDLSSDDPSRDLKLLELDPTTPIPLRYSTLSYCRGLGRGIPLLTRATLASHKSHILWPTLPKTFQEAILLSLTLNIRYLWIDALCVLQDDPSDTLHAALTLDSIFGNALLTLAATSSPDPSTGLFAPPCPTFKVQATDAHGTLSRIHVREQPPHYTFKAPFSASAHMNDWALPFATSPSANALTPLLRRAWPFAERLLAPRILHFTPAELVLECRQTYQCECARITHPAYDARPTDSVKQDFARAVADASRHTRRIDSVVSKLEATSLSPGTTTTPTTTADGHTPIDALELWTYVVTDYTTHQLTHPSDRLPAIAAVAKRFAPVIPAGYIAGHWTHSALGLLWYPQEGTHCRRPKQVLGRNVPSWSWASVEGSAVFWDNASAMDLACSAVWEGQAEGGDKVFSPFGGRGVELRAALAAEVRFREEAEGEYVLGRAGVEVEFLPDVVPLRGDDAVRDGEMLVCVLVSMSFRSSVLGLVLRREGREDGAYRRVGRFECYECVAEGGGEPEDAEALFGHWWPEVEDMTTLDERARQTFRVV